MKAMSSTLAAAIALLFAIPAAFFFTRAVADAEKRSREAPFRAVLGSARFDELMEGGGGVPHYLGNDRLAPDFSLRDRDGQTWTLGEHRGEVIVMNFWTVTCRPCIEEMPTLEELASVAAGWGDVEVIAISTDAQWSDAEPIIGGHRYLTHLIDPKREVVAQAFGTKLYPETWIIDRRGVVRLRLDGPLDWSSPIALELVDSFR